MADELRRKNRFRNWINRRKSTHWVSKDRLHDDQSSEFLRRAQIEPHHQKARAPFQLSKSQGPLNFGRIWDHSCVRWVRSCVANILTPFPVHCMLFNCSDDDSACCRSCAAKQLGLESIAESEVQCLWIYSVCPGWNNSAQPPQLIFVRISPSLNALQSFRERLWWSCHRSLNFLQLHTIVFLNLRLCIFRLHSAIFRPGFEYPHRPS
jgi:hypothetical protein